MRAATLNHEVFNHTVEVEAIVVAHFDQFDEVRHRVRGTSVVKFDCDVSSAGLHEGVHASPTRRGVKSIRFHTGGVSISWLTMDGSVDPHRFGRRQQDSQRQSVAARKRVVQP